MTTRIALDQIVDAAPARVVMTRDASGAVTRAAFDLTGLPRVDAALTGRPVVEVPGLVERLCGICPSAHHLAGMRALEALAGLGALPPTAVGVRRLLHHGGVIAIHVTGLIATHRDEALILRRFAKAAMSAAGSPGHFPATAIPGGVVAPVDAAQRHTCLASAGEALAAAVRVAETALNAAVRVAETALTHSTPADPFAGADLALTDDEGHLDLFGERLTAVAADGRAVLGGARARDWDSLVAEADPGSAAPRPYLKALGPGAGTYRVGPVAQLRVGTVATPVAAGLQQTWRRAGGHGAAAARAIIVVHAVETITALLDRPELSAGPLGVPWPGELPAGIGVGWVDGARGLLVHRYETTGDGRVAKATILTPTAQNEPWLGELLRTAGSAADDATVRAGLEDAIREADPCLPCSSAPAGMMDLVVDTEPAAG